MGGYAKAALICYTFMILLLGSMGVPLTNGFMRILFVLKSILIMIKW